MWTIWSVPRCFELVGSVRNWSDMQLQGENKNLPSRKQFENVDRQDLEWSGCGYRGMMWMIFIRRLAGGATHPLSVRPSLSFSALADC